MTTVLQPYQGSYLTPAYEEATVGEAMHPGVISCPPDAGAVDVARLMALNHVHCVVIGRAEGWGLITAMDVLRDAVGGDGSATAADMARTPVTVNARESLGRLATQMAAEDAEHALVLDAGGRPVGVVSSLDVAGIVAWGRA